MMTDETLANDYELTTKSFSVIEEQMNDTPNGVWQSEAQAVIDLNTLKGLYFNEDWVYILIDRIASKIAAQEMRVMRKIVRDGEMIKEPVENHPVQKRIAEPNENQTYYQFMYSVVTDREISGNSIVWDAQAAQSLIHIPIEMIQCHFDLSGRLSKYRIVQYSMEDGFPLLRQVMEVLRENVAHIRRPNPSSAVWGLSPFIPGRRSVLFNRYSSEYLVNFYNRGAQPGIVFDMSDVANEKAALRLLRTIEAAHQGRKNQRRNMVLPKGVKASSLAHKLAEQELEIYINQNREVIINILQVPKQELSIAEHSSLGSQEYKIALRNFWNGPLRSTMMSIQQSMTALFRKQLGDDHVLEFDLTNVDVLQEDLNEKADLSIKLLKTHTLNEVRARVFKAPALPGGDVTPTETTQQSPFMFSAPVPQMLGTPAPTTASAVDDAVIVAEIDENEKILTGNREGIEKARNESWWKKRESLLVENQEKTFAATHKFVLDTFAAQIAKVLDVVKAQLKSSGIKAYDPDAPDFGVPLSKLKRETAKALEDFEEQWVEGYGNVLAAQMELGLDAQIITPFGLPDPQSFQVARERNKARRLARLEDHSYEAFKNINKTSTDKIFRIIEQTLADGGSITQAGESIAKVVARNIGDAFTDEKFINNRAMTIARTEMLTATSFGQAAALELAAEQDPDLIKVWVTMKDERVRGPGGLYPDSEADHRSLEGQVVKWNEDWTDDKGLKYAFPRDPKAGAAGCINCRCAMIHMNEKDAEGLGISRLKPSSTEPGE